MGSLTGGGKTGRAGAGGTGSVAGDGSMETAGAGKFFKWVMSCMTLCTTVSNSRSKHVCTND